jgi:hypothetical protein
MLFTRKQITEAQVIEDARTKVTQVFVHPEHDSQILVAWDSNGWSGTAVQGCEIFRTSLRALLEAGWISKEGGGLSSTATQKIMLSRYEKPSQG